jgi:hypothetical protein
MPKRKIIKNVNPNAKKAHDAIPLQASVTHETIKKLDVKKNAPLEPNAIHEKGFVKLVKIKR